MNDIYAEVHRRRRECPFCGGEAERGMRPVLLTPVKSRHTATEPVRLWFDGANGTFETRE